MDRGIDPDATTLDHVTGAATAALHLDLPVLGRPTGPLLPRLLHLPDRIWAAPLTPRRRPAIAASTPTPSPEAVLDAAGLPRLRVSSPSTYSFPRCLNPCSTPVSRRLPSSLPLSCC